MLKDFDFGGSAVLVARPGGRELLLAGQKSGDVWALDPDSGAQVWNRRFGQGTPLGGVHWGLAVDAERVFAPINDPVSRPGQAASPGLNALAMDTGEILWQVPMVPSCGGGRRERFPGCDRRYGLSAVPLVVDDAVIAGAVDGRLYAFAAEDGALLFEYDTLRDFETLNGVTGRGGSIDAHSVAAGLGMVFVGSGYGRFGQAAGNVLLAFWPAEGSLRPPPARRSVRAGYGHRFRVPAGKDWRARAGTLQGGETCVEGLCCCWSRCRRRWRRWQRTRRRSSPGCSRRPFTAPRG